jgi:predicted ABC-type transport system involved in lysophospholipase L1 biosynthesis ATPase subunit
MDEAALALFRNDNVGLSSTHYLLRDFTALENALIPVRGEQTVRGVRRDPRERYARHGPA